MKSLTAAIGVIILLIISFLSGFFYHQYKMPEKIVVKEVTKTEYKYIKTASTCEEWKAAYLSPIEITGETNKDWLNVTASDGYKQSQKGFRIGTNGKWDYVLYAGVGGLAIGVLSGLFH